MVKITKTVGRTAVIVVAVLAVLGIGAVALNKHQDYQNKKAQAVVPTVPASEFEALKSTTTEELQTLQNDNTRLLAECQKGLTAYNALPVASKAKTPQPQCSAPVTQ